MSIIKSLKLKTKQKEKQLPNGRELPFEKRKENKKDCEYIVNLFYCFYDIIHKTVCQYKSVCALCTNIFLLIWFVQKLFEYMCTLHKAFCLKVVERATKIDYTLRVYKRNWVQIPSGPAAVRCKKTFCLLFLPQTKRTRHWIISEKATKDASQSEYVYIKCFHNYCERR